ncbi:unnamed protein product [Soboliphyme baturini]|uniref:F-actin-capping protein subunit alpha n=1 Tax=Soboliphyme baturini TaxID=241478 RepID=A0A183J660_9BILA|nr:unnamed protein product [Soboliphyme baturini]
MPSESFETISDKDRARIASEFIVHAPPGEFNEVFNDVRVLVNNDQLLRDGCAQAFRQYDKDQFTPVKTESGQKPSLVTQFNELDNGRFFDQRHKKIFSFDHLRKECFDVQSFDDMGIRVKVEPHRSAVQAAIDSYTADHYKDGVSIVVSDVDPASGQIKLIVCIECHLFQPKNFCNGKWCSQWSLTFSPEDKTTEILGLIKVRVHYYEEGNIQLISSKDVKRKVSNLVRSDVNSFAKEVAKIIEEEESIYQVAVSGNYQTMSDTTFKALRRQLPVTRTKIDWSKQSYGKIGLDLTQQ